ncbi:hypothetical protein CASFOL_010380 [Castilleja foliolosa]|uniref:Protein kinase domain-containing protein n=1 Tax=Castilleja foliolosa TaxID=1961234 RepID=A0ABD3DSJ7_9LAMI
MSAIYDNWERLVAAVLKKQQLWQLFHEHSRSPSQLSEASGFSSSLNSRFSLYDLAVDFARLGSSSRSHRGFSKLVFVSDFSPAIGVKDVRLASAELLGKGNFGAAYVAAMDNGGKIVLKRLKSMSTSGLEFNRHMAIVGGVKHKNVDALRAYYSSEDERLMMYDYYSTGSVYALLHGQNGESRAHVDWESRLKIAVGAAWGIAEIHKHNGGKFVHGNVKTSNVFLNTDGYGCVSDLSPIHFIETTFPPTAYCYAPEAKRTKFVFQASDVYSFGILLLELLTRKPTVHVPGGLEAVDLVKLVTSIRNWVRPANVFDADLLNDPMVKEQMVKMLQIGMKCVEKSLDKRPKMSDVVKMLEEISVLNPSSSICVSRKLIYIEEANPIFDLEDVLRASSEVLGKGTFGTSYKAMVEDEYIIMVKGLRDVNVTFIDFQQHMEIIGKMRHGNVDRVRAFCFSGYEKFLVYDYYDRDSVSALLHGKIGTDRKPLYWETRLKIAVGAARGIAHIHKQDGQKFVHGNLKSSNIFINGQNYGIVSDVGLAKLTRPVRQSRIQSPGYCAPEVTDTSRVSQASDIYSFGVLLLELLSGKPSQTTTDDGKVVSLVNWIQSVDRDQWTAEMFDFELVRYENEDEAMVQLLQIALDCTSTVPEHRPKMSEVVKMLEEISGIEPLNESGLEDTMKQQLFTESRLEDLLEDLLLTLTPL